MVLFNCCSLVGGWGPLFLGDVNISFPRKMNIVYTPLYLKGNTVMKCEFLYNIKYDKIRKLFSKNCVLFLFMSVAVST